MHLGVLLGCSPQHLILRAQDWEETKTIPDIGETVYDAQKVSIGKIADIFGPVKKPFVSKFRIRLSRSAREFWKLSMIWKPKDSIENY